MAFARTIVWRSLSRRPGRTLLSIAGIALGIVTVVGVFTLDHNTVVGMTGRGGDEWQPALEVRPGRERGGDPREELVGLAGVAGVSAMFQQQVGVRVLGSDAAAEPAVEPAGTGADGPRAGGRRGGRGKRAAPGRVLPEGSTQARLFALDAAGLEELDAVRLVAGRSLAPGADEAEVLLGAALAEGLGVDVGARVLLARPGRAVRRDCVNGELVDVDSIAPQAPREEPFRVVGILARDRLGRRSQGAVCVVDHARGRQLFEGARIDTVYWMRPSEDADIEGLRASIGESFSYELNKSVIVGAAADERAFRNGVRMAGLLALVLGLYVIFHTLSMSLVERVREVGTLHALGSSRGQIARVFLLEAVVIALAAGALGLTGGVALARVLAHYGVTTLGTGHHFPGFAVPWRANLALTALGVGVALLGSIYPLLRARNADTVQALRGEEALKTSGVAKGFHLFAALLLVVLLPALYFTIAPVMGELRGALVGSVLVGVGLLALLVVLPLVVPSVLGIVALRITRPFETLSPLVGRLTSRVMRDSPARVAVSAAAIALVAAAFVALKGMTASLRGEVEGWAEVAIVDKVFVRDLPNVPLDELEATLATYPGVLGVESGSVRGFVPFLILGLEPDELGGYGPCADDPALADALTRGGVIVSGRLARHLGYEVGDQVHVNTGAGPQDLPVVAVSDAYGYFPHPDERLYGVTSAEFMRRAYCLDTETTTQVAVRLAPGADPGVVEAALFEVLGERGELPKAPLTGAGLLSVHLVDIARDFALFDLILGLTALLAGLGVLNGQLLAALERAKELGVLKALGTSRRQIAGTVLLESAVVGLLGGLVGTLLGAGLTPILVRALSALSGLDLPTRTAGPWLALVPAGAVVLALAAGLYPIWRMNRLDAVAAVRIG